MPAIDLSILNQRQTPAFYADTLANRPSAGFIGRIFVSTNTFEFYRDNGTTWDLIGGPGTSTVTGTGANGQVTYWNGTSSITGSNNLFFDAVNGHLGVGTITPGTALDVKHDQSTVVQLEQETATNDTRIAFINSGVGLWRLGAFYNAGANDFALFDVVNSLERFSVKNTGQTFIGPQTSSSGKLVINQTASDNGIVLIGTTAPSIRIRNAGTAPTQQVGMAISTGVNNFIQGSASGDFCLFNGSTTASPILLGIYDAVAVSVQEAARVSAARNFLIGTATDIGRKLTVSGDGAFTSNGLFGGSTNPGNAGSFTVSVGVPGTTAGGLQLWAATNQSSFLQFGDSATPADNYRGFVGYNHNTDSLSLGTAATDRLTINSAGNVGIGTTSPTVASGIGLVLNGQAAQTRLAFKNNYTGDTSTDGVQLALISGSSAFVFQNRESDGYFAFEINANEVFRTSGTNLLIGTTTDAGQKLQVNGTALATKFQGAVNTISNATTPFGSEVSGANLYFQGSLSNGQQFGSIAGTYIFGLYFIFYIDNTTGLRGSAIYMASYPVANGGFNLVTQSCALTFSNVYNLAASISIANNASNRGPILTNNTINTLTFYSYVFGGV